MKESVLSFEEKTTQPCFTYFQNDRQILPSFKTNPLNIIFDDFSICLLGYRTEFSCLYLPERHNYCMAVKYRWICKFLILSESPSVMHKKRIEDIVYTINEYSSYSIHTLNLEFHILSHWILTSAENTRNVTVHLPKKQKSIKFVFQRVVNRIHNMFIPVRFTLVNNTIFSFSVIPLNTYTYIRSEENNPSVKGFLNKMSWAIWDNVTGM